MPKRKSSETDTSQPGEACRIDTSQTSIHEAIQRQVADLLANADISEEERQQVLIALSCPCCGAGGLSFSLKLKPDPDSTPSF